MRRESKSFENFYQAFVSCTETADALDSGVISTSKKSLKRPISSAKKTSTTNLKSESKKSGNSNILPSPYAELLHLQLGDGRWSSLEDVLTCLNIPMGSYLTSLEIWEEATLFALAMIRQRYDLFHLLGDSHDKAMKWVLSSKHLIKQATEIIAKFSNNSSQQSRPTSRAEGGAGAGGSLSSSPKKKKITFNVPIDPYRKLLEQSSRLNYSRSFSAMLSQGQEVDSEALLAGQINEERKKLALSLMNPSVDYKVVLEEILLIQKEFQSCENNLVSHILFLDQLRNNLVQCIYNCIERYSKSELQSDRNASFDELTASLGDNVDPRPGAVGWKKEGKKGFRTCLISLLNSLHQFAMTKQRLRSLLEILNGIDWALISDPSAKSLSLLVSELSPLVLRDNLQSRDDWSFRWGGREIGYYVQHSLDFLATCPLLVSWYGSSYPFQNNPFALAYPLSDIWKETCTDEMVNHYIHRHTTNNRIAAKSLFSSHVPTVSFEQQEIEEQEKQIQSQLAERLYRDQVLNTQVFFQNTAQQPIPNWWPRPPEVSDLQVAENILISLIVFRLLTRSSTEESQGKLAAALSRTGSRTGSRNSNKKTTEVSKSDTTTSTTSAAAATGAMRLTDTLKSGKIQQPSDYKAWLFTDDWYTHTHYSPHETSRPGTKLSSQSSPRRLVSSQSQSDLLHSSRRDGMSGRASSPSQRQGKHSPDKGTTLTSSKTNNKSKYHKSTHPQLNKSSVSLRSIASESSKGDSSSLFQEEVYDLMNKEKDSTVNEETLQMPSELGMIGSTLTDDDDILSIGEMRSQSLHHNDNSTIERNMLTTQSTLTEEEGGGSDSYSQEKSQRSVVRAENGKDLEEAQQQQPQKEEKEKEREQGEREQGEGEGEEDEDDEEDLEELQIIGKDTQIVTFPHQHHETRHRLSTVLENSESLQGLQAVPTAAYSHIDRREKEAPILHESIEMVQNLPIQKKSDEEFTKTPTTAIQQIKKKRHSIQKNKQLQLQHHHQRQIKLNSSSSSSLDFLSNDSEMTPQLKVKDIKNSRVFEAVTSLTTPSQATANAAFPGGNQTPARQSSPKEHPSTPPTTYTRVKLSIKEIKEKRKESLPARLKAAGLDQTSFLSSKNSSTLPAIPSTEHQPQHSQQQQTKKSKVTRIRILTRESSVKLTRRASSSATHDQQQT